MGSLEGCGRVPYQLTDLKENVLNCACQWFRIKNSREIDYKDSSRLCLYFACSLFAVNNSLCEPC